MASTAFLFLRIIFLIICVFSAVNDNTVLKRNFQESHTFDLTQGIQSYESTLGAVQWSHIVLLFKVVSFIYFLVHQLWGIISNERELDGLDKQNGFVAHKVKGVSLFYEVTENQFTRIRSKSSRIKEWFNKIEGANIPKNEEFNTKLEFLQKSLHKQNAIFSNYGIDLNEKLITEENFKAQLTMAQAFVGKTIRKLEADTKEDLMTVADVKKDIRSLMTYFR